MHILAIPSFFPPHGGAFCLDQAKALRDAGHEVRILACVQLGFTLDKDFYFKAHNGRWWEQIDGIDVYRTYVHGLPKSVRFNASRWISTVSSMYDDYVKKYGEPDVIHTHCAHLAGLAAMRISRQHHKPYFITEHLSAELFKAEFGEHWERHEWLRLQLIDAYQNAANVMPVAAELVKNLEPFFGENYRFTPVSNIVDTQFFAYRNRTTPYGRKMRFCCLAIASNIHCKGYDILAKAWEDIKDAELVIAGQMTDSPAMKQLFASCTNVELKGHLDRDSVRDLLYDCDALILASRSEAQPLVLLEAMSTGIPVIASDIVPQSLRIDKACHIFPTEDAQALNIIIKEMIGKTDMPTSRPEYHDAVCQLASPQCIAAQLTRIFSQSDGQ
ncbi:MAG: glycosyltransferase family 4 protein [Bacteroidales bacterium]|nr:glycosyltransferase family 4 protein [Candidatus Liminaster caballi]